MILLHLVKPDWGEVFFGMVPSKVRPRMRTLVGDRFLTDDVQTLVKPGALYVGVGIIGGMLTLDSSFGRS